MRFRARSAGEPYREDQIGMSVMHHWEGPDAWVFHSEWWLREHWGRAYEVIDVQRPPRQADGSPQITHSYIALRRLDVRVSRDQLERIDADHPRELAALQTSLRLARKELAELAGHPPDRLGSLDLHRALGLARRSPTTSNSASPLNIPVNPLRTTGWSSTMVPDG